MFLVATAALDQVVQQGIEGRRETQDHQGRRAWMVREDCLDCLVFRGSKVTLVLLATKAPKDIED